MENRKIYEDIAQRTDGDIYIGVVGPVRTGKSTFIKRFMETLVLPNIENSYRRERARDELPQSGSGRTIMTAEPKFVPEEAVSLSIDGSAAFSVRLIDCVGYMVEGAIGQLEDGTPRMVNTPWYEHEIPMSEAAEIGTRKVIEEHATIGIVITTDGSITDLPRESYLSAEDRVIRELKDLGKPFVVIVNSVSPESQSARMIRDEIARKYDVACMVTNCLELRENDITDIIKGILYEFPVSELAIFLPSWVDALASEHPIKKSIYEALLSSGKDMTRIRDIEKVMLKIGENEMVKQARLSGINLGTGSASGMIEVPRELFYETLGEQSGFSIVDDGDLIVLLSGLSKMKKEYDRVAAALEEVRATGYGIVMPDIEEMTLEEPEIIRQGGSYGVRLKAGAPSIHMIRADIETEISPIVGSEKQSEDLIQYLLREFEGNTGKLWDSNIFGKSLHDLINEGLNSKLKRMPFEARQKLQETLQRIINEGSGGLICIIL